MTEIPAWELEIAIDDLGRCIGALEEYKHPLVPALDEVLNELREQFKNIQNKKIECGCGLSFRTRTFAPCPYCGKHPKRTGKDK